MLARAIMTGTEATDLPDRYAGVEARIPTAWEELQGPSSGVVHLPTRLAWSGLTDFDVADPGDRFALYCLLLDCGQRSDIGQYDRGFAAYGLDAATIRDLREWAATWESDLRSRPAAEPDPLRPDEPDWDAYLDK